MRYYLLLLFLIPFSLAEPTIYLQNENLQPGETIFATINTSGEFREKITSQDLKFMEGRKEVFVEKGIYFHEGSYYLYFYPLKEGNFKIIVDGVLYFEDGILKESRIEKEIEVKTKIFEEDENSSVKEILSVKPGFIKTSSTSELKIKNLGNVSSEFEISDEEILLKPLEEYVYLIPFEENISEVEIRGYKIFSVPVINDSILVSDDRPFEILDLRPEFYSLDFNISLAEENKKEILLFNFGEENLTNITFYSNLAFVNSEGIEDLGPRKTTNLTIIFSRAEGFFEDNLTVSYIQNGSNKELIIPLKLFVLPEGVTNLEEISSSNETCEALKGGVCSSNEVCDGDATFTSDKKYCCLGECVKLSEEKEGSNLGWLWGTILFLILGGGAYYLYKKQKGVVVKDPKQKIEDLSKDYNQRLSGKINRS